MITEADWARWTPDDLRPYVETTVEIFGVDRVMYAMDYPYQFVPEEVKVTDELPISEDDRRKLFQLNAERVFRL